MKSHQLLIYLALLILLVGAFSTATAAPPLAKPAPQTPPGPVTAGPSSGTYGESGGVVARQVSYFEDGGNDAEGWDGHYGAQMDDAYATIQAPDIIVTPASLSAQQCPDTQTTQDLAICNDGDAPLEWRLIGPTVISFDDVTAPCLFIDTVALRDEYAGWGVRFMGPAALDGGGILDECGNFGVSGHSPPNFLAFNPDAFFSDYGIPRAPEVITFTYGAEYVQVNAGSYGGAGEIVTMEAFDPAGNSLGSDSLTLDPTLDTLSITATNISYVVIDSPAVFVLDDLAVSQPSPDIPWLSEDPTSGTVAAGDCATVTVTFDSSGLAPAIYTGTLVITSDDPDTPTTIVSATLTVLEPVSIDSVIYTIDGCSVSFDSTVLGEPPYEYAWTFGDGGTSTEADPTYTYATPGGTFTVTLTVGNACGTDVWQDSPVTVSCGGCYLPITIKND